MGKGGTVFVWPINKVASKAFYMKGTVIQVYSHSVCVEVCEWGEKIQQMWDLRDVYTSEIDVKSAMKVAQKERIEKTKDAE